MGRPRPRVIGMAVAVFALAVAGCSFPSNTPTTYDETTQSNFLQGCTQIYEVGGTTSTLGTGSSESVCECAYNWFVENLPFDADAAADQGKPAEPNFEQLDDALADDPNAVPTEVQSALAETCPGFGEGDQPAPAPLAPTTSEAQ